MLKRYTAPLAALAMGLSLTACSEIKPAATDPDLRGPDAQATAENWAAAYEYVSGVDACQLATPKLQRKIVEEAVALGFLSVNDANCEDAFVKLVEARKENGESLVVESVIPIEDEYQHAYFEIAWRESEEGDGMGLTLVKKNNRWFVSRS